MIKEEIIEFARAYFGMLLLTVIGLLNIKDGGIAF